VAIEDEAYAYMGFCWRQYHNFPWPTTKNAFSFHFISRVALKRHTHILFNDFCDTYIVTYDEKKTWWIT
jgi:hypothetical protein